MIRQISLAACLGLGLGLFAAQANAAPLAAPLGQVGAATGGAVTDSVVGGNIINVAEGCGRGRFRNRFGRCRVMRGRFVRPFRPGFRRCVTRVNRFGVRRRVCTTRR